MLLSLKELIDRAIEFLISRSKGSTPQERLHSAFRKVVVVIPFLIWLSFTLGVAYINTRIELSESHEASVVLNSIFEENPINGMFELNRALGEQLDWVKAENASLTADNLKEVHLNQILINRIEYLEGELKQCRIDKE